MYKVEYDDKKKKRKGDGLLFEYEGKKMIVYSCENGMRMNKLKEIEKNRMSEFDENGLKVYEGEYKGEVESEFVRDGEGDVFDSNDELLFSGYWKNGKREGKGMCYRNGVLYFDGEWRDDKPNGNGKLYDKDRNVVCKGNWKNGYCDMGNGIGLYYEDGKKCGLYENGNRKYEGEWKNGNPNGRGMLFDEKGNKKYEGEWKNGMIEIEKGVWFDYESGNICLLNERGVIVYRGSIKDNKPNGYGKVVNEKRVAFEGEWNDGLLKIDEEMSIEYENGLFYVNELQNSGLFGCSKKMVKKDMNDLEKRQLVVRTNRHLSQLNQLVSVLEIADDCCNDLEIDLRICNYSNLERIVVKKNSFRNLNSLVISNNPQLKSIETKDGELGTGACYNVRIMEISSIF